MLDLPAITKSRTSRSRAVRVANFAWTAGCSARTRQAVRDATTKALVEVISDAGYVVMIGADSNGNRVVEATDEKTGERFVVRGDNLYATVVELAQQVGIELEDG